MDLILALVAQHLGYEKHDPSGRGSGNSRNGSRAKTVFTEIGPVQIEVPRDTNSTFDPVIVHKRKRRLTGVDCQRRCTAISTESTPTPTTHLYR